MLRAVIFDLDGVIANTERLHLQGFRLALAAHDISISDQDYLERYLGFDDRDGLRAILGDNGVDPKEAAVRALMADKARIFRELVGERVEIFPGVRELVAALRSRPEPLPLAVGSGALSAEIRLILGIARLDHGFDEIVGADDVTRGKPDPAIFLEACARLAGSCAPGLAPADCLVIEDSIGGIEAGLRAGMKTVAVTNSFSARELAHADLVISNLSELDYDRCRSLFIE